MRKISKTVQAGKRRSKRQTTGKMQGNYICINNITRVKKGITWFTLISFFYSNVAVAVGEHELPIGDSRTAGSYTVRTPEEHHVLLTSHEKMSAADWVSHNIGSKAHMEYNLPSSDAMFLSRVTNGVGTEIYGKLSVNQGNLFLINPNGILFGNGATIDVSNITSSTLGISTADFLAGNYKFAMENGQAGNITIAQGARFNVREGGMASFVAPSIANAGVIVGNKSEVILAAGEAVTIDFYGDKLINLAVIDQPVSKAVKDSNGNAVKDLIKNTGSIDVGGGRVLFTAKAARDIVDNVINTSGVIKADSATQKGGQIILEAGDTGKVVVSGVLDASSSSHAGGSVGVFGEHVSVVKSQVRADGFTDAGEVLLGGNFQGKSAEEMAAVNGNVKYHKGAGQQIFATHNAKTTTVDEDSLISVKSSTARGGKAVVWSDEATHMQGKIDGSGVQGGFAEISAKEASDDKSFSFNGAGVNLYGSESAGVLLLDPLNINIVALGGGAYAGNHLLADNGGASVNISPANLAAVVGGCARGY